MVRDVSRLAKENAPSIIFSILHYPDPVDSTPSGPAHGARRVPAGEGERAGHHLH